MKSRGPSNVMPHHFLKCNHSDAASGSSMSNVISLSFSLSSSSHKSSTTPPTTSNPFMAPRNSSTSQWPLWLRSKKRIQAFSVLPQCRIMLSRTVSFAFLRPPAGAWSRPDARVPFFRSSCTCVSDDRIELATLGRFSELPLVMERSSLRVDICCSILVAKVARTLVMVDALAMILGRGESWLPERTSTCSCAGRKAVISWSMPVSSGS
mmetsp:Transcript_15411/g.45697  ORF Transcript_15411/g.45697 Transcript_15411/m.45697 type:complete len:209 (+) Transcript_15411:1651-2277(+)